MFEGACRLERLEVHNEQLLEILGSGAWRESHLETKPKSALICFWGQAYAHIMSGLKEKKRLRCQA